MRIFTDVREIREPGPTYLTIGNFDGLHRGHQALLSQIVAAAEQHPNSTQTALVTFDPHPLTVLRPEISHDLLTLPEERLRLAAELGIEIGVIQPFTVAIAALSARDFMALLKDHLGLAGLIVGPDFALGRNRSGDIATLGQIGREMGYSVAVVDPLYWQGEAVRSSTIRRHLQAGQVEQAADLLGRFYQVSGQVREGDHRGRQLGIPTANLSPPAQTLWPAYGVYATRTSVADSEQTYGSVTNIGVRPTVDGLHQRLETHLFDFPPAGGSDNLYGQQLSVEFVARLRDEKRFENIHALLHQIRSDIAEARRLLQSKVGTRGDTGITATGYH